MHMEERTCSSNVHITNVDTVNYELITTAAKSIQNIIKIYKQVYVYWAYLTPPVYTTKRNAVTYNDLLKTNNALQECHNTYNKKLSHYPHGEIRIADTPYYLTLNFKKFRFLILNYSTQQYTS